MNLVLAIDGGGSGCRSALIEVDMNNSHSAAKILGRGEGGAANLASDFDQANIHIVECANRAIENSGVEGIIIEDLSAVLGLAGANVSDYKDRLQQILPFAHADIKSDAITALYGALGERDGVMAAIGTGSVFVKKDGDKSEVKGGWGFQTSDLGSGARVGQRLIEYSLLSYDGFEKSSALTEAILMKFNNDPEKISVFGRDASPQNFGEFAPMLFEFAEKGDEIAFALLKHQINEIERHIDAIADTKNSPVCLTGGLGRRYVDHFSHAFKKRLIEPRGTPLDGAILLAKTLCERLVDEQGKP